MYLQTPPDRATLQQLIQAMGISVRALLRQNVAPYTELGLAEDKFSDEQLLDAMLAHPILINRPIVVTPIGTRLCRPSEVVLDILPQARVIRTAWLFSPCGRNFVRTILHLALRQPVLRIVNDQRGCPTSALQLARFLPALTAPSLPGGIYHLAGSPAVSWFEFAEEIFRCVLACGWPAERLPRIEPIASAAFAQAAPRPSSSILCSERSRAALCAQLPAEVAASLTLDWRLSLPEVVRTLLRSDPELQAVCAST